MRQPSYTVKEVQVGSFGTRYLEAGDPSAATVVLIHDGAFGTTAELCWAATVDALSANHRVIAPDLLGFGGTDKAIYLDRSPYDGRIPHVAALVHQLGIDSAAFVGVSFGGSLILRALLAPGNPWRIRRAISISGTGGPYRLQAGLDAMADYQPSPRAARDLTELLTGTGSGLDDHVRKRHENSLIPGHWESMMAPRLRNPGVERTERTDPYLEQLRHVSVPVCLVEGRHDTLLQPGWSNVLADLIPGATPVLLDCGHEPNIDAPQLVLPIIESFLAASTGGLET